MFADRTAADLSGVDMTVRRHARNLYKRAHRRARLALLHRFTPLAPRSDIVRLGSNYGGWTVPSSLVDSDSVCFSVGLGEDASFDEALIAEFGCDVEIFDPTPRAIEYARTLVDHRIHFAPVGIWIEDGVQKFFAPQNAEHVSHSIENLQATNDFFEADCITIRSAMDERHRDHLDLLKLDIEGAETAVLRDLLTQDIRPAVLCVEFDDELSFSDAYRQIRSLQKAGYSACALEGSNISYVHDSASNRPGRTAGSQK